MLKIARLIRLFALRLVCLFSQGSRLPNRAPDHHQERVVSRWNCRLRIQRSIFGLTYLRQCDLRFDLSQERDAANYVYFSLGRKLSS